MAWRESFLHLGRGGPVAIPASSPSPCSSAVNRRSIGDGPHSRIMVIFENVIIGAGPYGLSIAAHLRSANAPHAIIGRPMASWRENMPADMALKSEPFASNLSDPEQRYTFKQFHAARGTNYVHKGAPIPIADFIDYAEWFRHHAVPEVWDVEVRNLRWHARRPAPALVHDWPTWGTLDSGYRPRRSAKDTWRSR